MNAKENEITTLPEMSGATLAPRNIAEAMEFSKLISQSGIVPKDYQGKPANVLVAVQWGMELGLAPMQAMQNIAVINGRPSIWGDAMLAICQSHPQFEGIEESIDDDGATCTVHRKGRVTVTQSFTMADAKKAGLAGKQGPWTQYPKRMMQMRARSFALRDAFADALKGIQSAEEVQDYQPERDMGQAEVVNEPKTTRTAAIKDKIKASKKKQAKKESEPIAEAEVIDTETGEVTTTAWTYDELIAALGNCDNAERFTELQEVGRTLYHQLDEKQQGALSKSIHSVGESLE